MTGIHAEAPANSHHVLLVGELCIPILKRKRHQAADIPFDVARLSNDSVLLARYSVSIQNKFDALDHLPDAVDTAWNTFSSIVKDTAQNLVGTKTRTNKPWLSHETTAILEHKSAAKVCGDQVERKRLQSVFRAKAKADRETYLTRILDDVEDGFTHPHGSSL